MAPLSPRARNRLLNAIGVFFAVAGLYHLAVILVPPMGDGGSVARHGIFVAVNINVAIGLFARPRWFFWFFTALTLQQLHSHGGALWREWATAHHIDWQSVLVLVVVPVTWVLLGIEVRNRTAPSQPGP